MSPATLGAAALVHLAVGVSFLLVARTLHARPRHSERLPARAIVLWWASLGAYLVIQAVLTVVAAADDTPPVMVFLAGRALTIPLLCGGVWGLSFHLLYLFTGSRRAALPLALFFGITALAFYVASFAPPADAVRVDAWLAELEGTGEGRLYRAVYVAVGLPPIAAAAGYLALGFRVDDVHARYRAMLVGGSILAWIGSGLAARLSAGDLAKFLTLVGPGLLAAAAALLAYRPPRAIGAWLDRAAARAVERQSRDLSLRSRMRDLV